MTKVFVPNLSDYSCFVMNNDYIRAYETTPTYNSNVNYTDYYFKNNYYERTGTQNFNQYSTLPTCINQNDLSDNFYYRYDFDKILIIFIISLIIIFYLPLKIILRLFRRFN